MDDPQRQLSCLQHPVEFTADLLVSQCKFDFGPHILGTAKGVLGQHFLEDPITIRGVVEVLDSLIQGMGGEILQLLLEGTEGDGALVKILRRFRHLQTDTAFYKIVNTPVADFFTVIIGGTIQGGDQSQHTVFFLGLLA